MSIRFVVGGARPFGVRGEQTVVIEVETGKSDIAKNVQKVVGLSETVVFFFVTSELGDAWRAQLPPSVLAVTPTDLSPLTDALS